MYYKQLGYDNYDDYLNGPQWQTIHEMYFNCQSVPYRCTVCFRNNKLLLHKRSYAHLEPAFFRELIKKKKYKLLNKILSWKCHRCNDLCHFYDKKKTRKVELDYLFLWEREKKIHWRLDMVARRWGRITWRFLKGFYITPRRRAAFSR